MPEILSNVEKNALIDEMGKQCAGKAQEVIDKAQKSIEQLLEQNNGKFATKEDFDKLKEIQSKATEDLTGILKEQGKTIADFRSTLEHAETKNAPSYSELMEANRQEVALAFKHRSTFDVELRTNKQGNIVAIRKDYSEAYNNALRGAMPKDKAKNMADETLGDAIKVAGITGTVDLLSGAGSLSSVATALTNATILRLTSNSPVVNQFRNSPFIFDLCSTSTVPLGTGSAVWLEESLVEMNIATVAEGATKPLSQITYTARSSDYKKRATIMVFTDEFRNDFAALENGIVNNGLLELTNEIQKDIVASMFTSAITYNTGVQFKAGVNVPNVNDYDALAALSAQARAATFGAYPNAALMGSYKLDRLGISKTTQGEYLGVPPSIQNLQFIGNRVIDDVNIDNVLVGDFKQYNIQFKGGVIVRTGYNANDLITNKITTVLEQYYFNYISSLRAASLVKGATFAAVKTAIS